VFPVLGLHQRERGGIMTRHDVIWPLPDAAMPPRPPECRPPAEDMWQLGGGHSAARGQEGDPCGSGPVQAVSSDEKNGAVA
jgi:hypothetical protein